MFRVTNHSISNVRNKIKKLSLLQLAAGAFSVESGFNRNTCLDWYIQSGMP
jgi:hypothetical protein